MDNSHEKTILGWAIEYFSLKTENEKAVEITKNLLWLQSRSIRGDENLKSENTIHELSFLVLQGIDSMKNALEFTKQPVNLGESNKENSDQSTTVKDSKSGKNAEMDLIQSSASFQFFEIIRVLKKIMLMRMMVFNQFSVFRHKSMLNFLFPLTVKNNENSTEPELALLRSCEHLNYDNHGIRESFNNLILDIANMQPFKTSNSGNNLLAGPEQIITRNISFISLLSKTKKEFDNLANTTKKYIIGTRNLFELVHKETNNLGGSIFLEPNTVLGRIGSLNILLNNLKKDNKVLLSLENENNRTNPSKRPRKQ
ncbi:hypothetical protein BB559_004836 [Furculomyces boomerangus]|uniref:Uncharacterized protein n=1 Tax=Furculomyces boomerangus TaxID=61424 RepID=A0A2T9YC92_9FUNG|nr:hypothetical protein BB559_004836 [Furculomyces boomerangus]